MIEDEITLNLTDRVAEQLRAKGLDEEELAAHVRLGVAVELLRAGHVSVGLAAELAGMERAEFLAELGRRGVPLIALSDEETTLEFETIDAMLGGKGES